MPTYTARCESCSCEKEYYRAMKDSGDTPECCGAKMKQVILSAPMSFVRGRFDAFRSTVDGSIITSERGLREHNARNGVVNLADGYSDEVVRSGNFGRPKEVKLDPNELRQDLAESIHKVANGYKPTIEVQEDE